MTAPYAPDCSIWLSAAATCSPDSPGGSWGICIAGMPGRICAAICASAAGTGMPAGQAPGGNSGTGCLGPAGAAGAAALAAGLGLLGAVGLAGGLAGAAPGGGGGGSLRSSGCDSQASVPVAVKRSAAGSLAQPPPTTPTTPPALAAAPT